MDIRAVSPSDRAVLPLIDAHLTLMRASSPACSIHAMDAAGLQAADVRLFAVFEAGDAVAMGGLKKTAPGLGELKSMYVRADRRGRGLAKAVLAHLLKTAREAGLTRVSLETGSQEAFAAARAFYGKAGFDTCGPFGDYILDPNSVFMTRVL